MRARTDSEASEQTRLVPIDTWEKLYPWPTAAALRTMINRRNQNGADVWIVRVGSRVLVDETAFFAWAKSRNAKSRNDPSRRRVPRPRASASAPTPAAP